MRRLHQILKGESTFDDLLQRHRHEGALQDRIHRALPPALARHVGVVDARSAELQLGAASGAAASLLRQHAPNLQAALAREGFEFTGIRVHVQARLAREAARIPVKKQMDSASVATIISLAADLGDSPLAAALRRLAGARGVASDSSRRDKPLEREEDQDSKQ
jgi:hypothetical protein